MRPASGWPSLAGLCVVMGCGPSSSPGEGAAPDAAPPDAAVLDAAVLDEEPPDSARPTCDDDGDLDGHVAIACGGDDCDDTDPATHAGADDVAVSTDWTLQWIDDAYADSIDVEIDNTGFVHLFYSDGRLMEATDESGEWTTEFIDHGNALSAALATDESTHIAFEGKARDLHYGTNAAGAWAARWLDKTWTSSMSISLALDSTGRPHVAYENGALYYTSSSLPGSWPIEEVADFAWRLSLAVDRDDEPHVAYVDDDLFYASREGDRWTIETIEPGSEGNGGADVGLVLDAADVAHVSYAAWPEVRYATNAGGQWRTETAVPHCDYGSLAIDVRGFAHIACHDPEGDDLDYATNASGAWVNEIVDTEGRTGFRTSIRVHEGVVHVGYYEIDGNDVLYARRVTPDGVDQDCDGVDG